MRTKRESTFNTQIIAIPGIRHLTDILKDIENMREKSNWTTGFKARIATTV